MLRRRPKKYREKSFNWLSIAPETIETYSWVTEANVEQNTCGYCVAEPCTDRFNSKIRFPYDHLLTDRKPLKVYTLKYVRIICSWNGVHIR